MLKSYLERSMSFTQYENLIDTLLAEGKTTGTNQSDSMVGYGRLNRARMERLAKTIEVAPDTAATVAANSRPMIWLILTEGWCGDAAQSIPVIEKIAAASDNIKTRYLLRDENLELMDGFLSEGARSIPKLIALDRETLEVLGTWGARPAAAQQLFADMRSRGVEKAAIQEEVQRWYNADRGRSLQDELVWLIAEWSRESVRAAAQTHAPFALIT